jgi:hypothetical protein
LAFGEVARFAESKNQCLMLANCIIIACFRLGRFLCSSASLRRSGEDRTCLSFCGGFRYGPYSRSFSTGGGAAGEVGVFGRADFLNGRRSGNTITAGARYKRRFNRRPRWRISRLFSGFFPLLLWLPFSLPFSLLFFGDSSSTSSTGGGIDSRFEAALIRLLSIFFFCRLFSLRSSFSMSSAHQPANASHFFASTFSITWSIFTPAAFMRWRQSFSSLVENGGGLCTAKIARCCGACSARNGCAKRSDKVGRKLGFFWSSAFRRETASIGHVSRLASLRCHMVYLQEDHLGTLARRSIFSTSFRFQCLRRRAVRRTAKRTESRLMTIHRQLPKKISIPASSNK